MRRTLNYFSPGAEKIASDRLFGMFHSGTVEHNKEVIMLIKADGTVRVVFCNCCAWNGVDFAGLNTVVHYGAPRSLED